MMMAMMAFVENHRRRADWQGAAEGKTKS